MTSRRVSVEYDRQALMPLLSQIQALADSEKEALGFIPASAFQEAIERKRLIAAVVVQDGAKHLVGYLLHSGVFPNAKVQQIAVVESHRKSGIASILINALASELERAGFLSLRADVADNLQSALVFYARSGFVRIRERAGGTARGRNIIIHSRELETDNLFTKQADPSSGADLGIKSRTTAKMPVFAFDLNVYFDLVKERNQSERARRLFGEALGHTIRLVVADEFVSELRRTSIGIKTDPILQMALQLPRLPKVDEPELVALAAQIYETVFGNLNNKSASTPQALSDVRHIAHAAISQASAFVTRDGAILNARNQLLSSFGIDIATVEEVLDLLPVEPLTMDMIRIRGDGFEPISLNSDELSTHFREVKVPDSLIAEFGSIPSGHSEKIAIRLADRIEAVGAVTIPKGIDPIARMIVHVRAESRSADLFADYLLDTLIRSVCSSAPTSVQLVHLPGQSIVNKHAATRGFYRPLNSTIFSKIAVGRPVTPASYENLAKQIRRRTGLRLPEALSASWSNGDISITAEYGTGRKVRAATLEASLSPVLFVWPGRDGVIVPIAREYADELLGTATQATLGFISNKAAAFLSLRGYINAPRTAKMMRPNSPIIFYESSRTGNGRGAAVAVARIVSSVLVAKSQLDAKTDSRLVVDSAEHFSVSDDVLLTTFDNVMRFPTPVSFGVLKQLDAVGPVNLVSGVSLSSEKVSSILARGWSDGSSA